MAFRAANKWQSVLTQLGGGSRSFATPTIPKMKPMSSTLDAAHARSHAKVGEWAPVGVVGGMVMVAVLIGAHTAKQQLVHSPTVHVHKGRRESMPEVDEPDLTINSADKFVNKSFLRKVAHIQDYRRTLPDPVRPDPFTRPRSAETLKTAGIEPSKH